MNNLHLRSSFRSLHLSLRFVIPLAVALGVLAYVVVPLVDGLYLRWAVHDINIRSQLVCETLQDPLGNLLQQSDGPKIDALLMRTIQDERLIALGVCDNSGKMIYQTSTFPSAISCKEPDNNIKKRQALQRLPQGPVNINVNPIESDGIKIASMVLVHDMSFVKRRSEDTHKYVILLFVVLGVVLSLITVLVAHISWRRWMAGVRAMLRGETKLRTSSLSPANPELQPLVGDLRALIRSLNAERQFADDSTIIWNAETLRKLLHKELTDEQILVVSNREPYIHSKAGNLIKVQRPASGLVTAVEPILKACSGTWIAHGSGSADKETVDSNDRIGVPTENPAYTLRRVWLTKEEEEGYYYGFANEGLWPLCHIAHVRPVFRSRDWEYFVKVNHRFADTVIQEAKNDAPLVLVQDYHLALVPGFIRKALPKATVITFWHIPWPNPESFGICPWREELLEGMLGSTILGFHTRLHCKNFLETVDRYIETRIECESSTIFHKDKLTLVESYPISIQWPQGDKTQPMSETYHSELLQSLGMDTDHLIGIGVDRLDYTKGILERFLAIERMLELYPELVGKFSFIQIASPTRTTLEDYQSFDAKVRALAIHINSRFASGSYHPIHLKIEHHEPDEINRYYRAANVCMVTSLHDGMNLVTKEFVATRDDERGVLLLSQFTGAAHELHEALLVNPYHIEQTAETLHQALIMPDYEQRERMRSMRAIVRDFNVYRWAGRMLLDAARIRQRERLAVRIGSSSGKVRL